jgi:iron complex outermembrane recepter protein
MSPVRARPRLRQIRVLALTTVTAVSALAQTAPAPSTTASATAGNDEAVVLSPFEANSGNDRGYQAANTLGATRTNVAIRDLPMQINVVTEQLMVDRASSISIRRSM